ncbi:potassium-transporting ATPase subunit F [Paenibacillus humicola]|nr:potassium-transporting ATPase subunit F [Paenibacillus humicola]
MVVMGIIALALIVYLGFVLVKPESSDAADRRRTLPEEDILA